MRTEKFISLLMTSGIIENCLRDDPGLATDLILGRLNEMIKKKPGFIDDLHYHGLSELVNYIVGKVPSGPKKGQDQIIDVFDDDEAELIGFARNVYKK